MAKLGNNLVEYPSIKNVKTSIDCKAVLPPIKEDTLKSRVYKYQWQLFGEAKPLLLVMQC